MTAVAAPVGALPRVRRSRFWIAIGLVVLVVVVLAALAAGSGSGGQPLSPSAAQPDGAKAVVEVLRSQGIHVTATSTLAATRRAAASGATVLVYDGSGYLTKKQWGTVGSLGSSTVVVDAPQTALDALAPSVKLGSTALDGTLAPRCDLPALARSSKITGAGSRYTTSDTAATRCLPATSGGGYGVVSLSRGSHDTTVVGTSSALTNASVEDHDNAAFALALLGDSPTLVWYLPSVTDIPSGSGTLATLTPPWVTPSIALLGVAALAGAFWRGRRLGPLVVENLPVVVRSTETTEGRARLYARGGDRTHALDQVRIGTIGRLGVLVGLPRSAGVDEVVDRAASVLGTSSGPVRDLLVTADPVDDRRLVALSDGLRDLERDVAAALRPGSLRTGSFAVDNSPAPSTPQERIDP